MRHPVAVLAAVSLAVGAGRAAAQAPQATATRGTPTIDGSVEDACWESASWHGDFAVHQTGEPSSYATRFAICFDDNALYVAVSCPQDEPPAVGESAARDETAVYRGDVTEVFLQPGGEDCTFYQFTSDVAGNRYDGSSTAGSMWDAEWQVLGAETDEGWSVEFALPWASLTLEADRQNEWRLNVGREKISEPREISSWCGGAFGDPAAFGTLTGIEADLKPYLLAVAPARVRRQITSQGIGVAYLSQVENLTGEPVTLTATLSTATDGGKALAECALSVRQGATAAMDMPLPELPKPGALLRLQLADDSNLTRVVRLHRVTGEQAQPLRLEITEPAFRNTIFPTETITEVRGYVDLDATAEVLSAGTVTLRLLGKRVPPLATQRIEDLQGRMRLALPCADLDYGDYRVIASLRLGGKALAHAAEPLLKLKPGPFELRVDSLGRFVLNGKPFFPIGIYSAGCEPDVLRELKEAGFNATHTYGLGYYRPPEECLAEYGPMLAACQQAGMPALTYALSNKAYGTRDYMLPEWLTASLRGIARQIEDLRDTAGLLFWSLGEEFHSTSEETAQGLRAAYELARELDPYRPVFIGDYSPQSLARNLAAADAGIIWSYPWFYRDGETRVPLDQLSSRLEEVWEAIGYRGKPIIGMPQLYNRASGLPGGFAAQRAPNHFELRSMTYQAIIHGAAGVYYYCASGHQAWPGTWLAVKRIATELSAYMPVLLEPEAGGLVKVIDGKADVLCKRHQGDTYLFTVARSSEEQTVQFACPGLAAGSLHVLGEGRSVQVENAAFADHYRPYEARLYATSAEQWPLPSFGDIEAECAAAEAALAERERDNLASFVNGSYLEAESDIYHLAYANDGDSLSVGPYLQGKITLRFTEARTFTTIEVYGTPEYRMNAWQPAPQALVNGTPQALEVTAVDREEGKITITVKPLAADGIMFDFGAGLHAWEIRVLNLP